MPLVWRELFTRASLGRSGASKQLAPQRWPHPGRIIFSKNISLSHFTRAVLLASGRYRASDRGAPPQIDHTIGTPTNGKWPISWTNQRILIAGGRCKRSGMTASDITIQMKGP